MLMIKKTLMVGLLAGALFAPMAPAYAASSDVLGVTETQWQKDLKTVGGDYTFEDTFVDEVKESQHRLESKFGSEHFEKLSSRQDTIQSRHKKNSLLQRKQLKARSSFVLDLNLSKKTYQELLAYIPALGTYYGEHHIAQMLPYIAYCLNYDIKTSDLNFYLSEFLKRQTPVDVACERLYRLAESQRKL